MWVELVVPSGASGSTPSGYLRLESVNNLYVANAGSPPPDGNWYVQAAPAAAVAYLAPAFGSQADAEAALATFVAQFGVIAPS